MRFEAGPFRLRRLSKRRSVVLPAEIPSWWRRSQSANRRSSTSSADPANELAPVQFWLPSEHGGVLIDLSGSVHACAAAPPALMFVDRCLVVCCIAGTLHMGDVVLPCCVTALSKLLSRPDVGVRFGAWTNNALAVSQLTDLELSLRPFRRVCGSHQHDDKIQQLHSIGLDAIKPEHVFTSGGIARTALEQRHLRPLLLVDLSLEEEFDGLDRTNPNAVVVGLAPEHFHYNKLNEAFRVLLHDGGTLVALHEARNVAPAEVVMIGDDVRQDVHGAMELGMHGVLVQTGKYRSGDAGKIDSPPSYVALASLTRSSGSYSATMARQVDRVLVKKNSSLPAHNHFLLTHRGQMDGMKIAACPFSVEDLVQMTTYLFTSEDIASLAPRGDQGHRIGGWRSQHASFNKKPAPRPAPRNDPVKTA
ncbi:Haloacid dehalogenase-like hydrolase domain-containing protein 2 [Phytophthora pseudosyringae]|uniref:Haloacid dehalogenase-like hydrolase domain-containing protein 2 n=1 Tax=Phytophthora pseudosyringae TaxID=221518 RepID=A0A8T1VW03_9STRA|nr:Haloacid dehalogenase-like hydrolase domain-containing protein 2 [Phytophthora pseudosyringae]